MEQSGGVHPAVPLRPHLFPSSKPSREGGRSSWWEGAARKERRPHGKTNGSVHVFFLAEPYSPLATLFPSHERDVAVMKKRWQHFWSNFGVRACMERREGFVVKQHGHDLAADRLLRNIFCLVFMPCSLSPRPALHRLAFCTTSALEHKREETSLVTPPSSPNPPNPTSLEATPNPNPYPNLLPLSPTQPPIPPPPPPPPRLLTGKAPRTEERQRRPPTSQGPSGNSFYSWLSVNEQASNRFFSLPHPLVHSLVHPLVHSLVHSLLLGSGTEA